MQWLTSHHFTELNIDGVGLIMSDLALEFKQESFYSDIIVVEISVGELTSAGFELYYQLFTSRNTQQILLAKAKTGMVCFQYEHKKVTAVPEILKSILTVKNH